MKKLILAGASAVAAFTIPALSLADAVCKLNGQVVPCDQLPPMFGFMAVFAPLIVLAMWAVMILLIIVPCWIIFQKAGKPGWAIIVPFYNIIVMLEIIGRPIWWILLFFIPFVNAIMGIIVVIELAQAFRKSVGFAIGMIFLPFIFYPILAFGSAQYGGVPVHN